MLAVVLAFLIVSLVVLILVRYIDLRIVVCYNTWLYNQFDSIV